MIERLVAALVLAPLAGCAGLAPTVSTSARPDRDSGIVAGLFNRQGMSFALVLRPVGGTGQTILPMGEDVRWPGDAQRSSVAIQVPPGTYVIDGYFAYGTVSKEVISRRPNTIAALQAPFEVRAGSVVHLGEISVESLPVRGANGYTTGFKMRISPRHTPWPEVRGAFEAAYPHLASMPTACVLCGP